MQRNRGLFRRVGATAVATALTLGALAIPAAGSPTHVAPRPKAPLRVIGHDCPWATEPEISALSPQQLAAQVVGQMDLAEKISMVSLNYSGLYENGTAAIPSLCIPSFTLQDGPDGISFNMSGVTELPSPLAIASTFTPEVAYHYGQVEGLEAKGKGIDVLQGPNLNLARVPTAGREFEGYGEDPNLVSDFGVQDIKGIQSEAVIAAAKHFTAYNQETDRRYLNEIVSERALEELYLEPFRTAVEQGHVAAIMCAYGLINGKNACQDPMLYSDLAKWGFSGFVRSDLRSVSNPIAAYRDGLDQLKPAVAPVVRRAVDRGTLSMARIDAAVESVLTEMFAFGMIQQPRPRTPHAHVDSPADTAFAKQAAEQSMVLLANKHQTLPIDPQSTRSIAVIGSDASASAIASGWGSSHVIAPFLSTPLGALRRAYGSRAGKAVTYDPGGESFSGLPPIKPSDVITEAEGPGIVASAAIRNAIPAVYRTGLVTTNEVVDVPKSGLYSISLTDGGPTWLFASGQLLTDTEGPHAKATWDVAVNMLAHVPETFTIVWSLTGGIAPVLGWQYDTPQIRAAVRAAKRASDAIVFVGAPSQEAVDRPTLSLPGDEDELINAVAAVNRHTIVVINSGGAVFMPWLSKVASVLEAWYPGEEDGVATAAVLTGAVDPSGHLPITFPASYRETPIDNPITYPGVNNVVKYSEGLDIGYRYDLAHHLKPLFPFGFGLSYTQFSLSNFTITLLGSMYVASLSVTNTGDREGSDVIQGYVSYPAQVGEPPFQLRTFSSVDVAAHTTSSVTLSFPISDFRAYLGGKFTVAPGSYGIQIGDSLNHLVYSAAVTEPVQTATAVRPIGTTGPSH